MLLAVTTHLRNPSPRLSSFTVGAFFFIAANLCAAQTSQAPSQSKKAQAPAPAAAPNAPQSTHFPILLLASGSDPISWSLRIGQKGPERLDRQNYPPIPLDPAEVTSGGTADTWVYHAKDSQTEADVSIRLSREACSAPSVPGTNFTFRASVQHAQIGILNGCARIAAELFPRIKNPLTEDEDEAEKKPPVETIRNFKSPVSVAYLTSTGKVVLKRGATPRIVAAEGSQLAVSHDGKRLLFTRQDAPNGPAIFVFDSLAGKSTQLVTGAAQPFWSPDDTHFAFLKLVDAHWHLWTAPVSNPESAAQIYSADIVSLFGWLDAHVILAADSQQLYWLAEDGKIQQTLPNDQLYGDSFAFSPGNSVRVNPVNPDLLLVSAEWRNPPQDVPTAKDRESKEPVKRSALFLFEVRSKRRVQLSPATLLAESPDWSRDGLQAFFTGTDAAGRTATWRIFWDGTGLKRYSEGRSLAVGQ
jgi:hypothetical protein